MKNAAWLLLTFALCVFVGCSTNEKSSTASTTNPSSSSPAPKTPDADNTARNADTSTLADTPTSQSENATDLQISAAVRKSVVDDKSLSANAHNIKIMTSDGVVTLRGPVKSDDEKKSIESKAKDVRGVTEVHNLLEVEKNP